MKLDALKMNTQDVQSSVETKAMGISKQANARIFQMFTKSVYSNPIGTVCREIASNSFDSHTEAGVNKPVIIRKTFDNQTNTTYISFIDFGVGMSPERVYDIYGVYFESTKNNSDNEIGGFGIGGKTPLAYKRATGLGSGEYDNSFNLITVYNGIKYFYLVYEGNDSPMIAPLHEEPTTEGNGTEIRIPVLSKDVTKFAFELTRQLYYFENLYFENFEAEYCLENDYNIIKAKTFLFRGDKYSPYMHVCLGRVAYPIEYSALGLNSNDYRYPVALQFNIGEISVTVSREQLDYSEQTIKMLKAKLEEAKAEILEMVEKQYLDVFNLEDYFNAMLTFGNLNFNNGKSIRIGDMMKLKDIAMPNFKYYNITLPKASVLFDLFFNVKVYGKALPKRSPQSADGYFSKTYKALTEAKNLYTFSGDVFERKSQKQSYLNSMYVRWNMITKSDLIEKGKDPDVDIFSEFNYKQISLHEAPIKLLQELQDDYYNIVLKYAKDYTTLEVPAEYLAKRKAKRNIKTNETITGTLITGGGYRKRYEMKLEHIFNVRNTIVYGTKEEESDLRHAVNVYSSMFGKKNRIAYQYSMRKGQNFEGEYTWDDKVNRKNLIIFLMVAKGNVKHMVNCRKAIHVSQFSDVLVKRKIPALNRALISGKLNGKLEEIPHLYKTKKFAEKFPIIGNTIQEVKKYLNDNNEYSYDLTSVRYSKFVSHLVDTTLSNVQKDIDAALDLITEYYESKNKYYMYLDIPTSIDDNEYTDFWDIVNILFAQK